jgi:membrane-bound metal-dependent hydrolase YbcI (DUF457 family)
VTGKTHLIAGGLAAGLTLQTLNAPSDAWTAGLLLGLVAGLIPDIDTESSMASKMIPGYQAVHSGAVGRWLAILSLVIIGPWLVMSQAPEWVHALPAPLPAFITWVISHISRRVLLGLPILSITFLTISWLLRHILKHRGATHSLLALLLVAYVTAKFADQWTTTAIVVGYASHLLADFITLEGVSLAWPFYRHPIGLGHVPSLKFLACRTGGSVERQFWQPLLSVALLILIVWHLVSLV